MPTPPGLYALRRFKLLCAVERIAEQFDGLGPNTDAVIRVVGACSQVNARGGSPGARRSPIVIFLGEPWHTAIANSVSTNGPQR
jgi:hypothetical protein